MSEALLRAWREWFDTLNRRQRVRYWIWVRMDRFEEWLCWKDWWIAHQDFMYQTDGPLGRLLCGCLAHCPAGNLKRENDYCVWCSKVFKGTAER